ncbi:MAG: PEP-CTERM sorting domain-containing protein [Vicinamibacterales bacterium]
MKRAVKSTLVTTGLVLAGLAAGSGSAWAGGCNLYTTTSTCAFNGAGFLVDATQPTGTGVIDSFVRIQQKGTEQGYNTSGRPVQFDEKTDPNFTRNLEIADVPVVTDPTPSLTGNYLEFFLDINEPASASGSLLTLDQLKIFVSNTPSITDGYSSAGGGTLEGATKVYDMDTGSTDNWVNLDYNLVGGGSGSGDMVLYVPDVGFSGNQYIYLYSQFGCVPGKKGKCGSGTNTKYQSGAGFEEWWTLSPDAPPPPVPEPGTLLLLGSGLVAVARRRLRLG